MRSVQIQFDNRRVLPGETLSGNVIVKTDSAFECNRVVLKFRSRERTEKGSGENRRVEEKTILSRVFRISEGGIIPEGTTTIPFSFQIPRGLAPSYKGYNGDILHTIEAVVEVDWAIDPKMKREYRVLQRRPPYIPAVGDTRGFSKENGGLHIRLDSNIFRLDKGILVRFKVDERKRMRRVRFDIRKREVGQCGWGEVKHESHIRRRYSNIGPDDWGRWKEVYIGEGWQSHLPFSSRLFRITYTLKVTLEIGWDLDPSISVRLRFSDYEPEEDILDKIADDLGFKDW
ncbi:MAG: sporulation protein [Candidatus Thorarchaeota archaeon]